jgi:hypothetical protein
LAVDDVIMIGDNVKNKFEIYNATSPIQKGDII